MTDPETLPFAADFPPATRDDWRKLVDAVLKGAPFERLTSKTYDGLLIEPLYQHAPAAKPVAGRAPGAAWTILARVDHPDPAAANAQALDDLHNGATGLALVFAGSVSANGFGLHPSPEALERTLEGVLLDAGITIDLHLSTESQHVVRDIAALVKSRGLDPASVDLRTGYDPIGAFAATGQSARAWNEMAGDFAAVVAKPSTEGFRGPFVVADGRVVHDAGGSEAQELAFVLASAVAYLRALEASGMALETARATISFRLAADADQFLTMAKFRAVRKLWARVEQACGLSPTPAILAAETAWRMMTRRDANANMLRTTIAVAAAGLGGADTITALPHTAAFGLPDGFARRVVRNTQLTLLEESSLARVADPAAGAGALEAITDQLCASAWSLLQEIERAGGAWAALADGAIQKKIAATRMEREKAFARGKDILTGTNAFPDIHEAMPRVLDIAPVRSASEPAATALPRRRLAEPFEALRDASDRLLAKTGARPKIFLANLGTEAEFTARATFAKNFFETGGIDAVGNGAVAVPALPAAVKAAGAALVCICSSDKVYERDAEAAAQALKSAGVRHVYLAGRPGGHEAAWKQAGIQSFIYEGCDALATLKAAYDIIGV
jgi:methylmalonyl-CoA mutase